MSALMRVVVEAPKALAMFLIRVYQRVISPAFPPSCRFTPTCSTYALTSIGRYGLIKGGWLAIKRIARCHPWSSGGFDPVP